MPRTKKRARLREKAGLGFDSGSEGEDDVQARASAVVEQARSIAAVVHGAKASLAEVQVIADKLLDDPNAFVDVMNSDPARPVKDATVLCISCSTTDPACFSHRMLNKRGRHGDRVRRCRACVSAAEQIGAGGSAPPAVPVQQAQGEAALEIVCGSCCQRLPNSDFSRNQLQKARGGKAARCISCVAGDNML
jgi:hypothetical protein